MHHQTKHLAALIAAIGLSAATGAWAAPDLSACQTCHADLTDRVIWPTRISNGTPREMSR